MLLPAAYPSLKRVVSIRKRLFRVQIQVKSRQIRLIYQLAIEAPGLPIQCASLPFAAPTKIRSHAAMAIAEIRKAMWMPACASSTFSL